MRAVCAWVLGLHLFFNIQVSDGRIREFYLGAVEMEWNYAPNGNMVNNDAKSDEYIKHDQDRIGSTYRKVVYRLFENASFTSQARHPEWLGYLGPVLRAEVRDTIKVHFKNMAFSSGRNFSVHPHGVQYNKDAEGAIYLDNTGPAQKIDDGIPPGNSYTYVWKAASTFAPTPDDARCLAWAYHSHVSPTNDIDSGLVGALLICKRGTLQRGGKRSDVDKEYIIYMDQADEQSSWYLQSNLERCGNKATCSYLYNVKDTTFSNSNKMSHINGYVYGNLPGFVVSQREKVAWHFFSLNTGIQSAHFSGQVLTYRNHRVDTVTFYPATFISAEMVAINEGSWLLSSRVSEAYEAGMQAFLNVKRPVYGWRGKRAASNDSTSIPTHRSWTFWPFTRSKTRKYYIAAELGEWDYGASGKDLFGGGPLLQTGSSSANYFTRGPNRIGGKYRKAMYVEYTDGTFTQKKARGPKEQHLGLLGPVIKAEVGETIQIEFRNNADRPYSILPHGVTFTKENEGFSYKDPSTHQMTGYVAGPGETITYHFKVPQIMAAPTRDDPPCLTHTYHSAVDPVQDVHSGLIGPLLVCKRGQLKQTSNRPSWLDWVRTRASSNTIIQRRDWFTYLRTWYNQHSHFFLTFTTIDENRSWYIDYNIRQYTTQPSSVNKNDAGFRSSNRRHGINGRMFGNLEGLEMCKGDDVAWHVFGFGGQYDMHGVNFHGQTLEVDGNNVESKVIIPGSAVTMTSVPDNVGKWAIVCRTNFHLLTGMTALYDVKACGARPDPLRPTAIRRYCIAAEEVEWDYAPLKRDLITGDNLTDDSQGGYIYVKDTDYFIGSTYKKVVYREYSDATFTARKKRRPSEEHLGILGPIIKAEVGDVIEVVFKNKATLRAYSIHPQGVRYDKSNEGAKYNDGSSQHADDGVLPGQTYTYRWDVPERAGPGPNDPNCISWLYHSSVNSVQDINSGLVGPMVICSPGHLNYNDQRRDVDREFAILFVIFDENLSWYLDQNIQNHAPLQTQKSDPAFRRSNEMNSINGFIFGNVPNLVMDEGDCVDWYVLGLGSSFDFHPVHFHGQTFIHRTDKVHRGDVIEVFPSTSQTVQMLTDNPGTWILHCHFSSHVKGGMEAVFTVKRMV